MRIAHVFFQVPPDARRRALEILLAEAEAVRAMPGCRAFVPFLDPTGAGTLGVLHEWESADDFSAYAASPTFVATAALLRPMMVAPPVSRRFDARLAETVN
jgi:Uncharacterized conserved protein